MALEGESLCFGLYAYKPIEITETRIDFERRYFDFWDCELAKRLWHLIWFSPRHFRTPLVAEKLWFSPVFSEKININLPFIWIRWAEFLCCKKCIVIYCMIITKYFSSFVFRSSFSRGLATCVLWQALSLFKLWQLSLSKQRVATESNSLL